MDMISEPIEKKSNIGENIRSIRKVLGMNQRDLCEKMKVTQQTVSNIEKSEELDDETLEKVAKALGVPAEVIRAYDHSDTVSFIVTYNTANDNAMINTAYKQDIISNPLEKVIELYEKLIAQQKQDYSDLKNQLSEVVDELYNLKRGK